MNKVKKTGLFFGSFNPVHVGHMIIANFMLNNSDLDEVWMVVSPHNPHKEKKSLAKDYDRLNLVELAIGENSKIKASNVEFSLPKPSYTIDTLTYLSEAHPLKEFALIMGGDNLGNFHKWKNYEKILADYRIMVYKRPSYDMGPLEFHEKVSIMDAPLLSISASYVRSLIKDGKSIQYLVTDKVHDYLSQNPMYK